jgi:uracil-DNA glycosylase
LGKGKRATKIRQFFNLQTQTGKMVTKIDEDIWTYLPENWKEFLDIDFRNETFVRLSDQLNREWDNFVIYPQKRDIFKAFQRVAPRNVKVVILGQDPYHGTGQAHGLAFSVPQGVAIPPSLNNIFKELNRDMQTELPHNGNLMRWAEQGVLLLNSVLTVRANMAGSHSKLGWQNFTDLVIERLALNLSNIVFMLWGGYAQKKVSLIDVEKHRILLAPHPSPLSVYRGFLGCGHFSEANRYLQQHHNCEINWKL